MYCLFTKGEYKIQNKSEMSCEKNKLECSISNKAGVCPNIGFIREHVLDGTHLYCYVSKLTNRDLITFLITLFTSHK